MTSSELGLFCPKCHCQHVPLADGGRAVVYTRRGRRSIKRVRQCRNCQHRFATVETVVGDHRSTGVTTSGDDAHSHYP